MWFSGPLLTASSIHFLATARAAQESFYSVAQDDGSFVVMGFTNARDSESWSLGTFRRLGAAIADRPQGIRVLFEGDTGSGLALWSAQDTPEEIARPLPLASGALFSGATSVGWETFFVARDRRNGIVLWRTDGTFDGTRALISPDPRGRAPLQLLGALGGHELLLALEGPGPELWLSDGTRRNTRPLVEILPGRRWAKVASATIAGSRAYLLVDLGPGGRELWTTDGSRAGTLRLTEFVPSDPFGAPDLPPFALGENLVFFADDGVHGREPWVSDGTVAGTLLLADLCPGPCSSHGEVLSGLAPRNDPRQLLLAASSPGRGREPFVTDGTAAGTLPLGDLCPGPCSSAPSEPGLIDGVGSLTTFLARSAPGETALWQTDGTTSGTRRLTPPGVEAKTGPDGSALFAAEDGTFGDEVWSVFGNPSQAGLLVDLEREVVPGSEPIFLAGGGGRVFFTAKQGGGTRRLWTSDGTAAGTVPLPLWPAPLWDRITGTAMLGSTMVFSGTERRSGQQVLWVSDGTAAGTGRLTSPEVTVGSWLRTVGGRILFTGCEAVHGCELWSTDGTSENTGLVVDLAPGAASFEATFDDKHRPNALIDGQLLFQRDEIVGTDHQLRHWVSDGTAAGTRSLRERYPFLADYDAGLQGDITHFGSHYYFRHPRSQQVPTVILWQTDGTVEGTRPTVSEEGDLGFRLLLAAETRLFFTISEFQGPIWVVDEPGAPARRAPTGVGALTGNALVVGDFLLYGNEEDGDLWFTDGTDAGTASLGVVPALDLKAVPTPTGSFFDVAGSACLFWDGHRASPLVNIPVTGCAGSVWSGTQLFFPHGEPETGIEPWVLDPLRP